jgi:DNA-binding winged helix-turn-helix (wHTH) protein
VFEADFRARELRKQGRKLRLQDQPFAVLAVLLDQAGVIVTREELRSRVWPSDTFVDFDHSLNTAVNKLREVLGDSATSPRFIETVARRGYRFLGEVQWNSQPVATGGSERSADAHGDLPRPHRGITRALFGLIQLMYLVFYVEALIHWEGVAKISSLYSRAPILLVVVVVSAAVGIPVRLFFLSGDAFDYSRLGEKFLRIFPGVLFLDQLWALSPFLITDYIGFGAALAATAALLYVPFAERTLIRMAYSAAPA